VRAAQTAVYQLLQVDRPVPAVTPHDQSLKVKYDALLKAFE
jgi:oleate hydratase